MYVSMNIDAHLYMLAIRSEFVQPRPNRLHAPPPGPGLGFRAFQGPWAWGPDPEDWAPGTRPGTPGGQGLI